MPSFKDKIDKYNSVVHQQKDVSKIKAAIDRVNSRYETFKQLGDDKAEVIRRGSVGTAYDEPFESTLCNIFADMGASKAMHTALDTNKIARIQDWRYMAMYAECNDALDEIADECVNIDGDGEIIKLKLNEDIDGDKQKILQKEFTKYIGHFDLKRNGWDLFRTVLIEGEVFFEHTVHPDYKDKGVLGVQSLPVEIVDPVYNNVQNTDIKGFIIKRPVFNKQDPTVIERFDVIPMDKHQLVYINSGVWNYQKTYRISPLEYARKAYRQLSFIEEAIIIYRLTRAPERLVFDVDVGNMPPAKAEDYLQRVMQKYWASKSFDLDYSDVTNRFNPQSMMDAFWFARRTGSEGTKVTQLAGGQNLGELQDLNWFANKLYKALKVPVSRLNTESTARDSADILREELKFAKYVIRLQKQVAEGIRAGFITHLKLRELYESYNLTEEDIYLEFNVPTSYFEDKEVQKQSNKWALYGTITGNEGISKTFAQKKYLGWSEVEIMANRQLLRKDAELQWELNNLTEQGPASKSGIASGGAAGGGGGGGIPEFGGAPAGGGEPEAGGEEGAPPEAGEAPAAGGAPTAKSTGNLPEPSPVGGAASALP